MSKRKPESAHAQATRILQKLLAERGPLALMIVQADLDKIEAVRAQAADAYERAIVERDEARAAARTLAHAYEHSSRPPAETVARSLAYPVRP